MTAEHFAQTINRLKGKVTMIFITRQVPKGLQVDEVVNMHLVIHNSYGMDLAQARKP